MNRIKSLFSALIAGAMVLTIAGCQKADTTADTKTDTKETKTIGKETDNCKEIEITNNTDKDITIVEYKISEADTYTQISSESKGETDSKHEADASLSDTYSQNLLFDDVWKSGETRVMYVPLVEEKENTSDSTEEEKTDSSSEDANDKDDEGTAPVVDVRVGIVDEPEEDETQSEASDSTTDEEETQKTDADSLETYEVKQLDTDKIESASVEEDKDGTIEVTYTDTETKEDVTVKGEEVKPTEEEKKESETSVETEKTEDEKDSSADSGNTASASDSGSNASKSDSGSSCSTTTKTVHHDAVTHTEQQLVSEAYDEPVYGWIPQVTCNGCGATFSSVDSWDAHAYSYASQGDGSHGSYSATSYQGITGYTHHDAVYHTVTVVDQEAYDENVDVGC